MAVPGNTFCSGAFLCLLPGELPLASLAMGSPAPSSNPLLGLVPTTVSSYRFPPSGLPMNVCHSDGCPKYSTEFGDTLVEQVSLLTFNLVSEFELVVNCFLIGSRCTDCQVLRDDTFGLFVCHDTQDLCFCSPLQSTRTQGMSFLLGEHLENGLQGSASASQVFTVGKNFSSPLALSTAGKRTCVNPLAHRHLPLVSTLRDCPSGGSIAR